MNTPYDVIVVGLGAMGSSALYQLSQRNLKVLGIDQFNPPHSFGSSHGDTRITRQAIGEGKSYVPLVLRSYEIFEEIEKKTGKKLLEKVGGIIFGNAEAEAIHGKKNFIQNTIEAAEKYNIKHTILSAEDLKEKFPQFLLQGKEIGYFEENAGYLKPEVCIETQLELAKKNGVEMLMNTKVMSVDVLDDGIVKITTTEGEILTKKIILSPGSWMNTFFPELKDLFKVYRQVLYWFDCSTKYQSFTVENKFPIFIWDFGNGKDVYGFPAIDGKDGGIKVAGEEYSEEVSPDTIDREVTEQESQKMYDTYIKDRIQGINPKVIKSKVCMYTVTPDSDFIIDFHPVHKQIIIASPCSGHGFKHSGGVGEVLADLATDGKTRFDISPFSIKRFNEQ